MYIELSIERLLLRPLNVLDLQTVHEYASDAENTKYMIHLPDKSLEETRSFLACVSAEWQKEESSYNEFAILYDSVHIRAVSVYLNKGNSEGELGWILNKKYCGKRFATKNDYHTLILFATYE